VEATLAEPIAMGTEQKPLMHSTLYILAWIAGIYGVGYITCFFMLMIVAKEWAAIPLATKYSLQWPVVFYDLIKGMFS